MGSMLVLGVGALVFWLLTVVLSQPEPNSIRAVDYSAPLAQAREQAPFRVLAPEPVPPGWKATSVDYEVDGATRTWRLGFHDDGGDRFVGLVQSNADADDVIADATRAERPAGDQKIGGQRWMVMTAGDETALIRSTGGSTTVVTGNVPCEVVVTFVRSMR